MEIPGGRTFVGRRVYDQPANRPDSVTVPNGWGVEPPRRSQAISAPSSGECLPAQR